MLSESCECENKVKLLMVKAECLLLLWTEDCNFKNLNQSDSHSGQSTGVSCCVERNGNYTDTEEEMLSVKTGFSIQKLA